MTVKVSKKSIIVIEKTNHSGGYKKEIRYRKTDAIVKDVDYLIKTDDTPWFAWQYAESYDNKSYWQSWIKVY